MLGSVVMGSNPCPRAEEYAGPSFDGLGVSDVSENLTDTTHIVRILFSNGFQVPCAHLQFQTAARYGLKLMMHIFRGDW